MRPDVTIFVIISIGLIIFIHQLVIRYLVYVIRSTPSVISYLLSVTGY